jgi:hypothetical protein
MHKLLIVAAALIAASCGAATAQNTTQNHGDRQAWLASADTNHDGKISRAEFIAARGARFTQMDANHDGSLQASERPHWGDHDGAAAQSASTPAHANRGDANGDGVISRAEYDAQGGHQFDRLDTDHDGFLSQAELHAMHEHHRQNS